MEYSDDHPDPNVWWKNRRKMSYIAIAWLIVQTFLFCGVAVFWEGAMATLTPVVGWSYGTTTIIIAGYFGNAAIDEFVREKR